jgi:hypothetical protein
MASAWFKEETAEKAEFEIWPSQSTKFATAMNEYSLKK